MSNKPSVTRKILYNDNILRIISLVAAVLFWFIVVMSISPDYKRTIYNVPVTIDENTSALTSLGLHVVNKNPKSISVQVSGPRNLIGALTSADFVVTPNLSEVTKTGSYEIEVSAALKVPDNRVKISNVDPVKITVKFDTMVTKTIPIEISVEGGNVPEGYLMQTAVSNPSEITVSGPTSELSAVSRATVTVKVKDGAKKTSISKCDVVLLNASGEEVKNEHILKSADSVDVTVPILKTKTVPLKVSFENVPADVDSTKVKYTISPAQILIAGDEDTVNKMNEIVIGSINFAELDLNTTKIIEIPSVDGIKNVDNVTSAKVNITLTGIDTKTVDVTDFKIINTDDSYKYSAQTKKITGVKLFGPSDEVGSVTNLTSIVDMKSVQSSTGQHELPVTFEVPGKKGFWVSGSYNVVVNIKR